MNAVPPSFACGGESLRPRNTRRARPLALAGAAALAVALTPTVAAAYPSTVVFAPSGESLAFGGFVLGAYAGMIAAPEPVSFGSGWGGLQLGVLPSVDIASTPAGKIAFAGAEIGFDVYGPDDDGNATPVFNVKLQLLKEATYWPAISLGLFQVSPDADRGAMLGYFALSKSFTISGVELGQLTFGMMTSFQDQARIAPGCFTSGAPYCVFRGASPFEDRNGAIFGGYVSPWIGPVSFSIDHVGGTSAVSSTNIVGNVRFWQDDAGGFALAGLGGFFSNDRRDSPPGPGAVDGLFVQVALVSSLAGLFGWDPTNEWARDPNKPRSRRGRRDIEDPLEAPPLEPPKPTPPEPVEPELTAPVPTPAPPTSPAP